MIIRAERPEDRGSVRSINEAAFGRPDEANLIESLRAEGAVLLSLIAESQDQLLGQILFSRMWIDTAGATIPAAALAPMAVRPASQRQGIGTRLVQSGLDRLRAEGERIVIVLGHPGYYPRFGFSCERARNLQSPFPPEAFLALELGRGALDGVHGKVRYPTAFGL